MYIKVDELGGLKLSHGPEKIKIQAAIFAEDLDLQIGNSKAKTSIGANEKLLQYVVNKFGVEK